MSPEANPDGNTIGSVLSSSAVRVSQCACPLSFCVEFGGGRLFRARLIEIEAPRCTLVSRKWTTYDALLLHVQDRFK
ncbi:hypothetical protein ZHAS_00015359 [Anopheles sinensis]|uniref:Uncharacterized protein n=1 Tax=Anopheles sinensis TaxID=74873 RepID=A0A084WAS9_ANOSI|nr:hypothetical protein ZHAS_00015359 [Anopheles sinensis]